MEAILVRAFVVLVLLALMGSALATVPLRHQPEVHRAAVGGGVPEATYRVYPLAGERVVVVVETTDLELSTRLIDPADIVRESLRGPGRFELNVPFGGAWRVVLSGPAARSADYALTLWLLPNVPYTGDEGLEPGDAPSSCGGAHLVREGSWRGGLWPGDDADTFRFHASLGDLVSLTVKGDDLDDGADVSLALLDHQCLVMQWVDAGWSDAKSTPDTIWMWPAPRSGEYYARVLPYAGVGNYQLSVSVREPYPAMPMNDAFSGRDPSGPGDAVPVLAPGSYQARLHDEDVSDWFVVRRTTGTTLDVLLMPGTGSAVGFRAYDEGGQLLHHAPAVTSPGLVTLPQDATAVTFAIDRMYGGGNYHFSLAERAR